MRRISYVLNPARKGDHTRNYQAYRHQFRRYNGIKRFGPATLPKIKVFLWKATKGALPIGECLINRQIDIDPQCKRCGEIESVEHILFYYEFAQRI